MGHTAKDKTKLMNRIRRIQGQVESVVRSLESDDDCSVVLHRIAAARGAMNALMSEVLETHIRQHVTDDMTPSERAALADDLADIVRAYLK